MEKGAETRVVEWAPQSASLGAQAQSSHLSQSLGLVLWEARRLSASVPYLPVGTPPPTGYFGAWASWAPCWSGLDLSLIPLLLSELTLKVYMRPSPQEVRGLSAQTCLVPLSSSSSASKSFRNSSVWPCSYLGPSRQNPRSQ